MPKTLDTRDHYFKKASKKGEARRAASSNLPERQCVSITRVNSYTRVAGRARSRYAEGDGGARLSESLADQELIDRAREHIRLIAPAFGFGLSETPEFVPDPYIKKTESGSRIISFQQYHRGIPVFQTEMALTFDKRGRIQNVGGSSVRLPRDLKAIPTVPLDRAAMAAAEHLVSPDDYGGGQSGGPSNLAVDLKQYYPKILGRVALPCQPSVVAFERVCSPSIGGGPFGEDVPAHLVYFYQGPATRLGWHMIFSNSMMTAQYALIVAADSDGRQPPQVLYCQQTSSSLTTVKGNVWTHNPQMNRKTGRRLLVFPRPASDYAILPLPKGLPEVFPPPWIEEGDNRTAGNNTIAIDVASVETLEGRRDGDLLLFDPADEQGDEQKVLNLFYFCNFMHDFFYMLGFDEEAKNFQLRNLTAEGKGGGLVQARVYNQPIDGTASLFTRADGTTTIMNLGPQAGTNNHAALDSDVVFHEFTHGVSNRLIGRPFDPFPLQKPQSMGMSEGWSDYFALTIQNYYLKKERVVTQDWLTGKPGGKRMHPFTDDYAKHATFNDIGEGVYIERHNIGEIWCAALMKMNRDLGAALGNKKKGHLLGWQIVIEGMKHTPSNPNFLQGRDSILEVLEFRNKEKLLSNADFTRARRAVWKAFAHFGMGVKAISDDAFFNVKGDNSLPPGI